jgi:uncharacterized protein (UPF0335 family)
MSPVVLLCSALLAFQDPGPPKAPDEPKAVAKDLAPKVDEAARAATLAKYEEMRAKTAETAAAQSKLATWCEQNGLKDEMLIHLANVVRLDPKRDAAWRKLGFKKHEGRWMTDEQIAEQATFRKAEKDWGDKLKVAHKHIHGGKKQDEAQETLNGITEIAAVPAIYREFCGGGERDQLIAVQALGQIEGLLASRVLAALAIFGKTPEVRRASIETLRRRPADEFLSFFVGLLRDPFKYEVRPVGGPGSPGVLFVEGEQFNVQRFYAPPMPMFNPRPGDTVGYYANGIPFIQQSTTQPIGKRVGVPGSKTLATEQDAVTTTRYSFADAMAQAQAAAQVAQQQLAADITAVEQMNEGQKRFNDLVMDVAKTATGKNPGKTPKDWRDLLAKKDDKYAKRPEKPAAKPTITELVPINYVYSLQGSTSLTLMTKTVVDT